jgi:hypothetical protein
VFAQSFLSLGCVGRRSHAYEIHLKSLTTNDTHPDAAQPFLKALDKYHQISDPRGHMKVKIVGNYVSTLCRAVITNVDDILYSIQMWDWKYKEGYQVNHFYKSTRPETNGYDSSIFFSTIASATTSSLQRISSSSLSPLGVWKSIPSTTSQSSRNAPRQSPYLLSWATFHTQRCS